MDLVDIISVFTDRWKVWFGSILVW